MREPSRVDLAPALIALVVGALLFIPAARLLDSMYPGPHAGFTLMGVWLYLVVPGAAILGAAALAIYPRAAAKGAASAARLRVFLWLVVLLFFVAAILCYRATA